jgi:4-amino-4-deoxy-L-arabinose transferase-like glycosyltransferase
MKFLAKRRWRLLILGAALVLILVSRSFLYATFVQPIALFLWAAWRVMVSVNQNVYWTLLLAGGLIPLIWLLFSTQRSVARSAYNQEPLPPGRVEHWELLLAGANGSQKDRERFREQWDQLLQSVEARASRSDANGVSGADPDRTESQPGASHFTARPAPVRQRAAQIPGLLQLLPESLQRRLARFSKTDDRWMREQLKWMESELDIPNGN